MIKKGNKTFAKIMLYRNIIHYIMKQRFILIFFY